MNKGKQKLFLYIGLGLLALIVLLGILVPKTVFPSYTAHSPKADGAKAFFLLLREAGFKVDYLTEAAPAKRTKDLMFMTEPEELTKQDSRDILKWVAKGNTLLLLCDEPNPITKSLKLKWSEKDIPSDIVKVNSEDQLLKEVKRLELNAGKRLTNPAKSSQADTSQPARADSFYYGDKYGSFLARINRGQGIVIVVTDPGIITNGAIDRADNLIVLLNVVRNSNPSKIWFNELVHGYTWQTTARDVFGWPVRMVVIQLALGVLALFVYWGKRFGRPLPMPGDAGEIGGDYVSSLANIYHQGKARRLTLESLYHGFRRELTQYLGVSLRLSNNELVRIISGRPGKDHQTLEKLLSNCEKFLSVQSPTEVELFSIAKDLELWRLHNLAGRHERSK